MLKRDRNVHMTVDRYGTLAVLFDCSEVTLIKSRSDVTLLIFCTTFLATYFTALTRCIPLRQESCWKRIICLPTGYVL